MLVLCCLASWRLCYPFPSYFLRSFCRVLRLIGSPTRDSFYNIGPAPFQLIGSGYEVERAQARDVIRALWGIRGFHNDIPEDLDVAQRGMYVQPDQLGPAERGRRRQGCQYWKAVRSAIRIESYLTVMGAVKLGSWAESQGKQTLDEGIRLYNQTRNSRAEFLSIITSQLVLVSGSNGIPSSQCCPPFGS